jgi:SAM-dependent methyltransferase
MSERVLRAAAHLVFRGRRFHYRHLRKLAREIRHKVILEIGSGKPVNGQYPYSAHHLFDTSNQFIKSDIVGEYGHRVIDLTAFDARNEFDVVLCLNVIEHVYEFHRAFDNLYRAVKPGGTAIIGVPAYYPLHDEPADYWRFTEHSLRKLMAPYRDVQLYNSGLRRYPFAYLVRAEK